MARGPGRPSKFTPAIGEEICARLTKGETLTSICNALDIPVRTVSDWKDADETFSTNFARARLDGFDAIANDCVRISDDRDDDPASRRVRVETRLKLLARWDPKRYGERSEHNVNHGVQDSLAELLGQVASSGRPRPGA